MLLFGDEQVSYKTGLNCRFMNDLIKSQLLKLYRFKK